MGSEETMTDQPPDDRPGNYYVTAIDGERHAFLLGPYQDDHATALAMVDEARRIAQELDPRAFWYAYGTARVTGYAKPGILNDHLTS